MKYSTQPRLHTDKKYKELYNDLKGLAFQEHHEIFFVCCCLGFKRKTPISLVGNKDERFYSDRITREEYSVYYAIMMSDNDNNLSSATDDQKVLALMEEYANGGMAILIKECLSPFLVGENRIDKSSAKELPKEILGYLISELKD
jgi:hypothetical protein